MVASPDHLLRYDEQDPEWQREEYEMVDELLPLGQFITVRCVGCVAEKTTRTNGLLTKSQHLVFMAAVLWRDGWFARRGSGNSIDGICPDCSAKAMRCLGQ